MIIGLGIYTMKPGRTADFAASAKADLLVNIKDRILKPTDFSPLQ